MAKSPDLDKREDDVMRRLIQTPPKPHKARKTNSLHDAERHDSIAPKKKGGSKATALPRPSK
jgi:hypothetical protein